MRSILHDYHSIVKIVVFVFVGVVVLRGESMHRQCLVAYIGLLGLCELDGVVLELLEVVGVESVEIVIGKVVHGDSKSQEQSRIGPLAR